MIQKGRFTFHTLRHPQARVDLTIPSHSTFPFLSTGSRSPVRKGGGVFEVKLQAKAPGRAGGFAFGWK